MRTLTVDPFDSPQRNPLASASGPGLRNKPASKWPTASLLRLDWRRPLYVREDLIGNLISATLIAGMLAVLVPLAYIAMMIVANFYVLSQSNGIGVL